MLCFVANDRVEDVVWSEYDSGKVLIGNYQNVESSSSLIAAFDYDNTIIKTISGKAFPVNQDDWKLLDNTFPKLISNIVQKGYRFVIISNQMGISKGRVCIDEIKHRFNESIKKINVPCLILIATHDDIYRKPRTGLWNLICDYIQPGVDIDYQGSFYVGDAAGRDKSLNKKKDHSSGDLLFAINCGLKFMVPEKLFKFASEFNANEIPDQTKSLLSNHSFKYENNTNEDYLLLCCKTNEKINNIKTVLPKLLHCIIFCGLAASGKSTFYRNHFKNDYVHVNMDNEKSLSKCVTLAKKCFISKKNCVIDNTNVDKANRAKWIKLCQEHCVIPILFYFQLPLQHIFHNCTYRKLLDSSNTVNEVIIYTQNKKIECPTVEECENLYIVNFVAKFSDSQQEQLYSMYLSDK